MIDVTRILCPIDFSDYSRHVFASACAAAKWYSAPVTVLHVVTLWPAFEVVPSLGVVSPPVSPPDVDRTSLQALLEAFIAQHRPPDVRVEPLVREAPDVHRAVLEVADDVHADLIVMGTHGRSGFEHVLLGSITEKVLRKATCPVMAIPQAATREAARVTPHFRRILCPTDFSAGARAALTYALSLGEEEDARVTLLHVVEVPPELSDGTIAGGVELQTLHTRVAEVRRRQLEDLVPASARECCWVDTAVVEGKASREIVRMATERASDLIVMGAHGRGALDVLVFGSNTHAVIRAGLCPVLTVPASAVPD